MHSLCQPHLQPVTDVTANTIMICHVFNKIDADVEQCQTLFENLAKLSQPDINNLCLPEFPRTQKSIIVPHMNALT